MASAAIGGGMMPLEVFSPVMRRVAHVTPQAWGNDAFAKLVGHGASVAGILPQLGVLAAVAAVLLALAAWRLRCILLAQPGDPRSGPKGRADRSSWEVRPYRRGLPALIRSRPLAHHVA